MGAIRAAWLCLAITFVAARAVASEELCIPPEAREAFACEGPKTRVSARRGLGFEAPAAHQAKKPRTIAPPDEPRQLENEVRDSRKLRVVERQLLLREISQTERLLKATPPESPDHPRLQRRLAESYVELANGLDRESIDLDTRAKKLRKKNPSEAADLARRADQSRARMKRAQRRGIDHYRDLASEHPTYCTTPGHRLVEERGCVDEILYFLAYELERAGNDRGARDVYLRLVQSHPGSKYVPSAYLAFAELFFDEARGDGDKWSIAAKAYEKVLEKPAAENPLWGYAQYKLGYVHWNTGDHARAIEAFKRVIEYATQHAAHAHAKQLASAARRDLIPVYAQAGDPARAYDFFRPLSGGKTREMLEDLGVALLDTGHYEAALVLYRDLIARFPKGRVCRYRAAVAQATMALSPADKRAVTRTLDDLAAEEARLKGRSLEGEDLVCANLIASLVTETAMAWHVEAVGSGGVKGTGDSATIAAANHLYEVAETSFEPEQWKRFRFPRIVKEDWPTLARVRYAHADLLFHQKDWRACGKAFSAAYEADPEGPDAAEALFTSAQCWQEQFFATRRGDAHRRDPTADGKNVAAPRRLGEEQKAMLSAFDRYACRIEPPNGDAKGLEQWVEVSFARARLYLEAGHFDRAALAFRALALEHSRFEAGLYAGHLYLASLEAMRRHWAKPSCVDDMRTDLPALQKAYCGESPRDAELCERFAAIAADLERLEGEALVALGALGGPGAREHFRRGAEIYLGLWKSRGAPACEKESPACAPFAEVLFNAARAYQAAHLLARAIDVRKVLVDPKYHLHATDLARQTLYDLGANHQAIAAYEAAAGWYERFATVDRSSRAATALSDAVVMRLGLGQTDQAMKDAQTFRRLFGRTAPGAAAHIGYAVAAHHAAHGRFDRAERSLAEVAPHLEAHAPLHLRLEALALRGRVAVALERRSIADRHYGALRDRARDMPALKKEIEEGVGTADSRRNLGRALMAIGEALHHFAEKERRHADAIAFPKYAGPGTPADVDRFIKHDVARWLERKRPAIEEATKAYMKIIELSDPPPPRWAIAAGAAVGAMWAGLVDDFLTAPYPASWDQAGVVPGSDPPVLWHELRATYKAALAEAVAKHKDVAKKAYSDCLDYGVLFQHFDDELRNCETWLSRNYPAEFHLVDELHGLPNRTGGGLAERPQALALDGRPTRADAEVEASP